MSDLGLEAIKALDLESYFDALLREWYDGVVQRGDGAALVADLRARGLEVDALVAEVERLRTERNEARGALWRACHDAWATADAAMRHYLDDARVALHPEPQIDE